MKKRISHFSLILGLFLVIASQVALAQKNTDYVFIETNTPAHTSLIQEYTGNSFVFFNDNVKPALYVYDQMLAGRQVNNLFIYVETQPGALLFPAGTITSDNIDDFADYLNKWSAIVQGNIIIKSTNVFSGNAGALLKTKLQSLTGSNVEMSITQEPFSF